MPHLQEVCLGMPGCQPCTLAPSYLHAAHHPVPPPPSPRSQAAERAAREEAQRQREARAAKLAADAKARAAKAKVLRKRTGHGQPVMKYRVEAALAALQAERA